MNTSEESLLAELERLECQRRSEIDHRENQCSLFLLERRQAHRLRRRHQLTIVLLAIPWAALLVYVMRL